MSNPHLPSNPFVSNAASTDFFHPSAAKNNNFETSTSDLDLDHDLMTMAWVDALKAWESIRDLPPTHRSRRAAVSRFRNLVPKGIPPEFRAVVWQKLLSADKLDRLGLLESLLSRPDLPIYDQIDKDIGRTYPNHDPSSPGQVQLANVLKAYAQYNPDVGYTQGMNFITGLLLLHMPPDESLCTLIALMTTHKFPHHSKDLSHLHMACKVMDRVSMKYLPKVARLLSVNDVSSVMYLPRWWMSGFEILPWGCRVRAFDCVVVDGFTGFCRVSVAILACIQDHLLNTHPTELLDTLLHPMPRDLIPDHFTRWYVSLETLDSNLVSKIHAHVLRESGGTESPDSIFPAASLSNSLSSSVDLVSLADQIKRGGSLPPFESLSSSPSFLLGPNKPDSTPPGLVARWLGGWSNSNPEVDNDEDHTHVLQITDP